MTHPSTDTLRSWVPFPALFLKSQWPILYCKSHCPDLLYFTPPPPLCRLLSCPDSWLRSSRVYKIPVCLILCGHSFRLCPDGHFSSLYLKSIVTSILHKILSLPVDIDYVDYSFCLDRWPTTFTSTNYLFHKCSCQNHGFCLTSSDFSLTTCWRPKFIKDTGKWVFIMFCFFYFCLCLRFQVLWSLIRTWYDCFIFRIVH